MANTLSNIKIEPCNVTWGNPHTTKITCLADVADSLDGTYVVLYNAAGTKYHIWYNTSGGAATDPAPASSTAIEVAITTGNTAAAVATATITAVNAVSGFNAKVDPDDSSSFILQNEAVGSVTANIADTGSTGFTLEVLRTGASLSLGYIEGDIEIATEEDYYEVTAQQEGTQVIEKIRTGARVASISVVMKEGVAAKIKTLLEQMGVSSTPSGGTEVTGFGKSKLFTGISSACRRLIFNPTRLGSSDRSEDICVFRTYPMITGMNFSGENARLLNVEFSVLPDPLLADANNMMIIGDHQQLLLK